MSAGKWVHINLFPQNLQSLNAETLHHPRLMLLLANHPSPEWEIKIAEICNYCSVLVNGTYLPEEIDNLCGILVGRLVQMRERTGGLVVIESSSTGSIH